MKHSKHFARKKGQNSRQARPGNKNGAKGPRLGRKDKTPTTKVAAPALPQPAPDARSTAPTGRSKTPGSGRDFQPGTNSHDGTVFQRGGDRLPRGNMILFNRIVYHDARERMYQRDMRIIDEGSDLAYLRLREEITNRIHGTPTKHVEKTTRRTVRFIGMTPDGQQQEMQPRRQLVDSSATPATAPTSTEDAMILGTEWAQASER